MYICAQVCAFCLRKTEEGVRSSATGGIDGYKLPYGCWELRLGLLEERALNH